MHPLVFQPYLRPQIWGSRRLGQDLGKTLPAEGTFGESWEISAHPHHLSCVAEGPMRGLRLVDLWQSHARELTGRDDAPRAKFPWLIKFLDCHEQLSVQVHPSDRIARELLGDEMGKTEAWVVLSAEPSGQIQAGLKPGITEAELVRHIEAGTVGECLHRFTPRPGDCIFLPAGTVHAVGGGVVLAEVQQSSDATFRLFDWNRLGPDGKPRALHRAEALRSIDWSAGPVAPVMPRPLPELAPGVRGESLVSCKHFRLDRYRISAALPNPYPERMSIWMLIGADAELRSVDGRYHREFRPGETVLIPASAGSLAWSASTGTAANLLAITDSPSGANEE
jgi:mannose-6-phosphate isomerase